MKRAVIVGLISLLCLSGCERKQQGPEAVADEPESVEQAAGEDEEHEGDEVHLAAAMEELGRRYASVWYGAQAQNTAFVDYQIHEIEEVIDDMRSARPVEHGVDIVEFFDANIFPALERLEETLENNQDFEAAYDAVIQQCNACHIATEHGFIKVKRPDFNPYPNLDVNPG